MTWLALRLLRPYLMVAGLIAAAATGYLLFAAGVIQRSIQSAASPRSITGGSAAASASAASIRARRSA